MMAGVLALASQEPKVDVIPVDMKQSPRKTEGKPMLDTMQSTAVWVPYLDKDAMGTSVAQLARACADSRRMKVKTVCKHTMV